MSDHAVAVVVLPALAAVLGREMRSEMHCGGVVPKKEWLLCFGLLLHPSECGRRDLLVDGFHALFGQRTSIRDGLSALAITQAMEHAARAELLFEFRVLGVIGKLWLLFGIQVIEITENSSKPCTVGRYSSRSPRWFLPN